ncbi:MAG: hypothetical protein ACRC5M_04105 [Anaeroplasmataceae bacterium]
MNLNYLYNFKNPLKHFININSVKYPDDIEYFNIKLIDITKPINFRIRKQDDKYRVLKLPNILNFRRAYEEFKSFDNFIDIQSIDPVYKRLSANIDTGDFVEGEYDKQLELDFERLCVYDNMIKVDIKEYYGRIYTHNLGIPGKEQFITNMNNRATNGLIMGNYLSLYLAELYLAKISCELASSLTNIECEFSYFSDDFYFFCNKQDNDFIIRTFDKVLERFELERNDSKKEIWTYESFNNHNLMSKYWKKVISHSNIRFNHEKNDNKLYFINQLVYRISNLDDTKLKKVFINNFFKTKYFRELDSEMYLLKNYDYHQLCFLFKTAPESLLYSIDKFCDFPNFDKAKLLKFMRVRYKESLKSAFNDEQLYYYYAIKNLDFTDILNETTQLVLNSENQVLISYYLKESLFNEDQIVLLKSKTGEEYWFQNYHLILYYMNSPTDLTNNINLYLLPQQVKSLNSQPKKDKYINFYKDNLSSNISIINELSNITATINDYLNLKFQESERNNSDI